MKKFQRKGWSFFKNLLNFKLNKKNFFYNYLIIFYLIISNFALSQEKLDKLLEMDLSELISIKVISATKIPQVLSSVPATVHIITKEQIRENGYFTLEQALMDLSGFQFRNILGFNSYIFMRGLPSQNNLILLLVDGVLLNELNSGGFYGGGNIIFQMLKELKLFMDLLLPYMAQMLFQGL